MASLHKKTEENTSKLRALGFQLVVKWEHEFLREKKEEENLVAFLKNHALCDRLNPRDAFFGGRTNAVKLFHEGPAKYVDFTSLYPWVRFFFFCLSVMKHFFCYFNATVIVISLAFTFFFSSCAFRLTNTADTL